METNKINVQANWNKGGLISISVEPKLIMNFSVKNSIDNIQEEYLFNHFDDYKKKELENRIKTILECGLGMDIVKLYTQETAEIYKSWFWIN